MRALRRLGRFWAGQTDLAPLGLFRIVFGLLLFNAFWQFLPDLDAFFTDEGVLPRAALFTQWPDRFSLLFTLDQGWQLVPFWIVCLAVSVLVTIGLWTRPSLVLAFVLLTSVHWRNPLIADGSDYVMRLAAFWLIFTAAGDRYAVDAAIRRARGDPPTGRGFALPIRVLELQIAWIYLATGIEKLLGKTWLQGTAVYYAFQATHTWARPWAAAVGQNMIAAKAATWGTLALELAFIPLVFSPLRHRAVRLFAVAMGAALHGGIALFLNIGNFPIVMLATLILFVPADLVERAVRSGQRLVGGGAVRLYYDGGCHFCRRTVAYLAALDIYRTLTLVDFRARIPVDIDVPLVELEKRIHAVDERGRVTRGFAALARASRGVPLLLPLALLAWLPIVSHAAERGYDFLARRRLLLLECPGGDCGTHDAVPPPARPRVWRWAALAGSAALLLTAAAAFATALVGPLAVYRPPEPVGRVLAYAGLEQRWNMFSPEPPLVDGWLRLPARFSDGTRVDLATGGPVTDEPRYGDAFGSRWAKLESIVTHWGNSAWRSEYARSFCRLRNRALAPGQPALVYFEIHYTELRLPPPGGSPPERRRHHLWNQPCS